MTTAAPETPVCRAGCNRCSVMLFMILSLAVLAGDLALKHWSFQNVAGVPISPTPATAKSPNLIPQHDAMVIVPNILSLKLTLNFGAVFGLGAGGRYFFIVVSIIAMIVIVATFWRSRAGQRALHVGLALVLAGAMGNLYDRMFCGAVRDMLYLFPGVHLPFGWSWPGGSREVYPWIFNIADASLLIGVGLILLMMSRSPKQGSSPRTIAETPPPQI